MANEPNWGRHSTIATYVAIVVGIVLFIISEIWPPDPAHPMKLDFLSKSISVSLWLAFMVVALVFMGALAVARRWYGASPSAQAEIARLKGLLATAADRQARTIPVEDLKRERQIHDLTIALRDTTNELQAEKGYHQDYEKRCADLTAEKTALQHRIEALSAVSAVGPQAAQIMSRMLADPKTAKSFDFDPNRRLVKFTWKEKLAVEVSYNATPYGLILCVINDSPDWIGAFRAEIADAESWNETHRKFLETRGFGRKLVIGDKTLAPMSRTKGAWLVRVAMNGLEITDQGGTSLDWPNNDPATIQIWRIALVLWYDPIAANPASMKFLDTVFLLVRWDRDSGKIAIADGTETVLVKR